LKFDLVIVNSMFPIMYVHTECPSLWLKLTYRVGVSECDCEASKMGMPWPTRRCWAMRGKNSQFRILLYHSQRRTDADTYPDVHTLPDKKL